MDHQPIRILYVCHDGELYGSQQSLNLLVKYLPKERYQCFVSVARPGALEAVLRHYPNVTVLRHRRLQWVKHDPRSCLQRIGDILTLAATALPRVWYLFNTIRREKINVVHTNSSVSLEGALAAALAGIPHIWHIREMFMEKSPKFHLVLGCKITRWLINHFSDTVICISEAVRNQFGPFLDQDPERFQVVYNALELNAYRPLVPGNDPQRTILRSLALNDLGLSDTRTFRVGYIGRLSEGKGFHELLEAVAMLKLRDMSVEVLVAGNFVDEAYKKRILDRVQQAGLEEEVHFLGYRDDLTQIYEVIDLLVVPSRNEPFGRVVIEAMANGIPCIATHSGGIPEIIDQGMTGLLYPPGDVYALAGLIEELAVAFWKLETIRQNARRMVEERFNIDNQIRILDECYQSVIARHQL
ncbi:MAG TPA: glycosyltransferase family 4 protein [Oculatellaceae cyanobacterium]|jgi:glycosyltransferase involved in cell wall biosynthesis